MRMQQVVAAVTIASILSIGFPQVSRAADSSSEPVRPPDSAAITEPSRPRVGVASIERAARAAAETAIPQATRREPPIRKAVQMGGGGGTGMMVMSMVSMVAGLAMTYYMIKAMRDQNNDADGQ